MKRALLLMICGLLLASGVKAQAASENALRSDGSWQDLQFDFFGDAPLQPGDALFQLEAPVRAENAAMVPLRIVQPEGTRQRINALSLIIDENPAPLAVQLELGKAMHPLSFETHIRVDQYSNVRVVADSQNQNYMIGRFVKASGGCSAPASSHIKLALAKMGQMRLREFGSQTKASNQRAEAQIMIHHPNYSGLQRNQITQLFVPAHFIHKVEVYLGDEHLFSLEGGISLSENPAFRFKFRDNGASTFRVRAEDTDGNVFEEVLERASHS